MLLNNKMTTDRLDISECFNDFFGSIAQKTKNKILKTDTLFSSYLKNPNNSSFLIAPTTEKEIADLISTLNPQTATGPDSIPTSILKLISPTVSKPLSDIINISFSTGVFPSCLKKSTIIPIHKKDSKLLIQNYRPISLLSNISKIIEKLMHARLQSFLTKFKCLYNNQFGFRTKHSTNHALLQITETIRNAIDEGKFACGIFVDLQKAFDTVEHSILLGKLNHYGIRGITNDWFKTYLTGRSQSVTVLGKQSKNTTICHGVPQGSVLGPLLFLIYINDLHNAIKHSSVFHFADDTSLLNANHSMKKINRQVNHDLKLLCVWLRANKLSLNAKKTELIIFKSKNKCITKKLNFRISGQKLYPTDHVKYLGITLDQHLSWEMHLKILTTKLNRAAGMLAKIRYYLPYETLLNVYYAIFNSHLIYGCQIWGQGNSQHTHKISSIQNKTLRIIHFKTYMDPVNPLFQKSKVIKLDDYISILNCLFAYDHNKNNLPVAFEKFFLQVNEIHNYNTRSSVNNNLFLPVTNTMHHGTHSIKTQSILTWNNMQNQLKIQLKNMSKSQLKHKLDDYFLKSYI